MILLMLISLLVADDRGTFVIGGADRKFNAIPGSITICKYEDYSCNKILCQMLRNRCLAYVFLTGLSTYPICSQKPSNVPATLITFGISGNLSIVNRSLTNCNSVHECLMTGCEIYNRYYNIIWTLYTGSC